jgi:hypothetical protein
LPISRRGYLLAVARIVVVSSTEIDPAVLGDHVDREDELHVVVPVVEQSRLEWLANDEDRARERAEAIGEGIAGSAPATRSSVDVKSDVPSQAVLDAIAEHNPERILFVLREGEDASWLESGELDQVPDEIAGVPVTRLQV